MEELDWEGSDDEHPAQEAPHEEGGDDEGLEGLEGLHSRQVAEQPQQLQRAGSMTPPGSPERPGGAANRRAETIGTAAASASAAAAAANGEPVPEEWQVMDIPEEWRPRPMVRVWGLPAAAQEEELAQLLEATLAEQRASVRSVVFDPRQTTAAGKVALVRFEPPPPPEEGTAEPDAGKVAEKLIAALRAAAPQLHGAKINVEKTGAEVRQGAQFLGALQRVSSRTWLPAALKRLGLISCTPALASSPCKRAAAPALGAHPMPAPHATRQVCLFLSNLPHNAESDEGLRATCAMYGALERCFVMRNPAGASKGYAFAEFTLPGSAAACKEAWNKAGEALRPQLPRESSGDGERGIRSWRAGVENVWLCLGTGHAWAGVVDASDIPCFPHRLVAGSRLTRSFPSGRLPALPAVQSQSASSCSALRLRQSRPSAASLAVCCMWMAFKRWGRGRGWGREISRQFACCKCGMPSWSYLLFTCTVCLPALAIEHLLLLPSRASLHPSHLMYVHLVSHPCRR